MKLDDFVLKISSWHTPASDYPVKSVGNARIERSSQGRGYYRMEGVDGYVFYHVTKPIKITLLKIGRKTVMTDDPINWHGMQALAKYSGSRILIGGLGLGLIIHALAMRKTPVEVKIVEINRDVIELITPLLPKLENMTIEQGDITMYADEESYDTIILDIWSGKGSKRMLTEMYHAYNRFKRLYPRARVYIWGHGDARVNPAVDPYVRTVINWWFE